METITQVEELKEKIIESMRILSHLLYDEERNLYPVSHFLGGEEERQNKINLLNEYQSRLKDISDGNKINGVVNFLKKKSIDPEIQVKSETNRSFYINYGQKKYPSVYTQIQYPDGKYHEAYVFYKGHSDEHNTDFIGYWDKNNQKYMVLPVNISDGKLMVSTTKLSTTGFMSGKIFSGEETFSFEQLLKEIPSIIENPNVEQYETVSTNVAIDNKSKSQGQGLSSLMSKILHGKAQKPSNKMYYYKVCKHIDPVILCCRLKELNPKIDVSVERFETCDNSFLSDVTNDIDIITSSVDLMEIVKNSNERLEPISENEYKSMTKVVDKKVVLEYFKNEYLPQLKKVIPSLEIRHDVDDQSICFYDRISEDIPIHIIKAPYSQYAGQIFFTHDSERHEYIYYTKGDTFLKYTFNKNGNYKMEFPYNANREPIKSHLEDELYNDYDYYFDMSKMMPQDAKQSSKEEENLTNNTYRMEEEQRKNMTTEELEKSPHSNMDKSTVASNQGDDLSQVKSETIDSSLDNKNILADESKKDEQRKNMTTEELEKSPHSNMDKNTVASNQGDDLSQVKSETIDSSLDNKNILVDESKKDEQVYKNDNEFNEDEINNESNNQTKESEYNAQIDLLTKQIQYLVKQNEELYRKIEELENQLTNQEDMENGRGSK